MVDRLPSYDELPKRAGLGCSWGLWGEHDVLGALNLITPQRTAAAASEIRDGALFPLDLPFDEPSPPLYGRTPLRHQVLDGARFGGVDDFREDQIDDFNTQLASQWDGFRHVEGAGIGHYNGLPGIEHGVDRWAQHGIAGRAVLADVGRWRAAQGRPIALDTPDTITADDLRGCLADEGVEVGVGDILLVRTGWPAWWRALPLETRVAATSGAFAYPGLLPDESVAALLWDLHIAAIGTDAPAVEAGPPTWLGDFDAPTTSDDPVAERARRYILHVRLLALLGIPMGELFDLDRLADACAADGRYTAFLTSVPLNLRGATGTPPNALAIR